MCETNKTFTFPHCHWYCEEYRYCNCGFRLLFADHSNLTIGGLSQDSKRNNLSKDNILLTKEIIAYNQRWQLAKAGNKNFLRKAYGWEHYVIQFQLIQVLIIQMAGKFKQYQGQTTTEIVVARWLGKPLQEESSGQLICRVRIEGFWQERSNHHCISCRWQYDRYIFF